MKHSCDFDRLIKFELLISANNSGVVGLANSWVFGNVRYKYKKASDSRVGFRNGSSRLYMQTVYVDTYNTCKMIVHLQACLVLLCKRNLFWIKPYRSFSS